MKKDLSFSKQVSHVTLICQPFFARKLCVTLNDGIKTHFNYPLSGSENLSKTSGFHEIIL